MYHVISNDLGDTNRVNNISCNVVQRSQRCPSSVATCNVVPQVHTRDLSSVATCHVVSDPRDLSNMAIYPVRSTRNVNMPPHPTPTPRQRAILKKEAKRTYGFPAVGINITSSSSSQHQYKLMLMMLMLVDAVYPLVNYHNYGKSSFFMGKPTINGHLFNSKLLVYQRV